MDDKFGFTLIELLAVIVVLAIIAIISVPMITKVIDRAKKGALVDSAYGINDSANLYYSSSEGMSTIEFTCNSDGCTNGTDSLRYSGNIDNGKIKIFADGKTSLCIEDDKYAALKLAADTKVTLKEGTCNFDSETYQIDEVVSMDEYKKLQDKLNAVQSELDQLKTLGDATPSDILVGKTAVVKGNLVTGTFVKEEWKVVSGTISYVNYANIYIGTGKTVYAGVVGGAARVYRTDGETMYTARVATYYNSGTGYVSFSIDPGGPLYANTGENSISYVIVYK